MGRLSFVYWHGRCCCSCEYACGEGCGEACSCCWYACGEAVDAGMPAVKPADAGMPAVKPVELGLIIFRRSLLIKRKCVKYAYDGLC